MRNRRYHAQRNHVISSLNTLLYQLLTLSFLLSPAFLLALLRVICQFQSSDPRGLDPNRSLRFHFGGILFFNSFSVWSHAWYGPNLGKAVLLDFVGLATVPSKFLLLTLDVFIIVLQFILVTISYETHVYAYGSQNEPDTLLPSPPSPPSPPFIESTDDVENTKPNAIDTHNIDPVILHLTLSAIYQRLRASTPPAGDSEGLGLPLPNTTSFPMPAGLRMLMRAQARARANAERGAARSGSTRQESPSVPGDIQTGFRRSERQ